MTSRLPGSTAIEPKTKAPQAVLLNSLGGKSCLQDISLPYLMALGAHIIPFFEAAAADAATVAIKLAGATIRLGLCSRLGIGCRFGFIRGHIIYLITPVTTTAASVFIEPAAADTTDYPAINTLLVTRSVG